MNKPWALDEMVYLTKHYATKEVREICAHLDRSVNSIHGKATAMELHRENGGRINKETAKVMRKLQGNPTPLRDKIIALFAEHQELTINQMRKACNARAASCWRVCDKLSRQGNIHISRYQAVESAAGNFEAIYRIGAGVNAERPTTRRMEPKEDAYEIQPIPRPKLGLWGLVWNTTTPAQPAERNTAP